MNKKNGIIIIFIVLIIGIIFGEIKIKQENRSYKVVFIPKAIGQNYYFWLNISAGAKAAIEEINGEILFKGGNDENDFITQNNNILWAIEQDPDIILFSPGSYTENTKHLEKVKESGIKLVLVDSIIDKNIADKIVLTDNLKAGIELGEYAYKNLENEQEAVIIGHIKETSTAKSREEGIRKGLKEKEYIIKEVKFCDSDENKAYEQTKELLKKYPNMSCIFGLNQSATVGAGRAIKEFEKKDEIEVYGFDNSIEEIQMLESRVIDAIIIQKPFNMGYIAVKEMLKEIEGKSSPKKINSGFKLITRSNMYDRTNQQLLFPFSDINKIIKEYN